MSLPSTCAGLCSPLCGPAQQKATATVPVAPAAAAVAMGTTPGETEKEESYNSNSGCCGCCAPAVLFVRRYFWIFMILILCLIVTGIVLLALGIKNIATGKNTTNGAEFVDRHNKFQAVDSYNDIATVTGTIQSGSSTARTVTGGKVTSGYFLDNTAKTWADSRVTGVIPVADITETTGDTTLTLSLTYTPTCAQCTGAAAAPQTGTITTTFPVTNGTTGFFLSDICIVVKRTNLNTPYILDTDKKSCFYPFDDESSKYSLKTGITNVGVTIRSFYDVGYFFLEEQSEGSLRMKDEEILLVDPNTPTFLGAGAALLVIGVVLLILHCCCCR